MELTLWIILYGAIGFIVAVAEVKFLEIYVKDEVTIGILLFMWPISLLIIILYGASWVVSKVSKRILNMD